VNIIYEERANEINLSLFEPFQNTQDDGNTLIPKIMPANLEAQYISRNKNETQKKKTSTWSKTEATWTRPNCLKFFPVGKKFNINPRESIIEKNKGKRL